VFGDASGVSKGGVVAWICFWDGRYEEHLFEDRVGFERRGVTTGARSSVGQRKSGIEASWFSSVLVCWRARRIL
jgi:hypothetical protein